MRKLLTLIAASALIGATPLVQAAPGGWEHGGGKQPKTHERGHSYDNSNGRYGETREHGKDRADERRYEHGKHKGEDRHSDDGDKGKHKDSQHNREHKSKNPHQD